MSGVLFREDPTGDYQSEEISAMGNLKLIPAKAIDRAAIGVYDINHKSSA